MRGHESVFTWEAGSADITASTPFDQDDNDLWTDDEESSLSHLTALGDAMDVSEQVEVPQTQDLFAEDMRLISEQRDRQAYTRIFQHFAPRLIEFSRRQMVNEPQARELVQETMLIVWKKAHLYDPTRASTTTWIYRICRNLRFDMLRKRLQLKDEISADDIWPSLEEAGLITSHASMYQQIAAEQVIRYYKQLPPAQQEIVRMLYLEEKSHQEVADELEIPLGTVKSRVRLAINRLKQLMESHD